MKKLSGTLLAILLAALLGMGVMAFTTAAPETERAAGVGHGPGAGAAGARCASRTGG